MLLRSILIISVVSVALTGCFQRSSNEPNVELIQDMMIDPAVKAQDFDHDMPGKRANRLPPEGTVPMNWTPYPNYLNDDQAKDFKNPIVANKDILAKGQKLYQIYCAVCHGTTGYGNGTVADVSLVKPPSLLAQKIKQWTDGQINHLITKGRGLMGAYESQIPSQDDRWALVHYIRHLQNTLPEGGPEQDPMARQPKQNEGN